MNYHRATVNVAGGAGTGGDEMSEQADGREYLAFSDAEIAAVASVVNAMLGRAGGSLEHLCDYAVTMYDRLLDATANAKIRLKKGISAIEYGE